MLLKCQLQRPRLSQLLAFWSQYHSKPRSRGRNYSHYPTEGGLRDLAAPERGVSLQGVRRSLGISASPGLGKMIPTLEWGSQGTVEPSNRKPSGQEHGHTGVPGAILMPRTYQSPCCLQCLTPASDSSCVEAQGLGSRLSPQWELQQISLLGVKEQNKPPSPP